MSETAKVRVVRCPKCENLLPEVTDYSVYQCGGCGAVLRAKNKGVDLDKLSERSDEERAADIVEKLPDKNEKLNNSEKGVMDMNDGSESDARSVISSSSGAGRRRILRDGSENYRTNLMNKEEKWDIEADKNGKIAQEFEDLTIHNENGFRRNGERGEIEAFRRSQRIEGQGVRYVNEDSPNFLPKSNYNYEDPVRKKNDIDGFSNVDFDLLKKLDEIKDHLSRSGNMIDKGKEKVPFDRSTAHQDPYGAPPNRVPAQYPYPDQHFNRPNQYSEPLPLMRRQEMDGNGYYPPHYAPSHGYADPFRRGPHQAPSPYQEPPHYMTDRYMNDGMGYMDHMEPYHHNINRNGHHAYDTMFNYHENRGSFGRREYNSRISNSSSLRSQNPQLHTSWPSDVNSEVDGFTRRRFPAVHLPSGGRHCRPIGGGAPFLTCHNCFELLLLPKKVFTVKNNRKKMKCGACSTLIVYAVSNKNLLMLADVEEEETPVKFEDNLDGNFNQTGTTFSSNDYDDLGYDVRSMGVESGKITGHERAYKPAELKNRHSASSYTSEAEEEREKLPELPTKNIGPQFHPGPPVQNRSDYPNNNRFVEGNISGRSESDKVVPNKATTQKNLTKESSSATEIDILSNEYYNTGTTYNSGEGSREGERLKASRRAESFFGGLIGKNYKDSNKANQIVEQEKANVTVNGHLIPDRLIKKAEKLAGPIQPGHYWYDFRAGFWGAVGGHCLGIIPPFISEFNYPMPEKCSGGNTQVFVNGRELSQKDLNLLGNRGLPTDEDRSYIIEISGRILDEDTGEELESLGKLAPTVERAKRGFGMKDPREAARPTN